MSEACKYCGHNRMIQLFRLVGKPDYICANCERVVKLKSEDKRREECEDEINKLTKEEYLKSEDKQ